jgi:hypothetical protein
MLASLLLQRQPPCPCRQSTNEMVPSTPTTSPSSKTPSSVLRRCPILTPRPSSPSLRTPEPLYRFPPNGQTLYNGTTVIAGRVGDMLSGFMGLNVWVTNVGVGGTTGRERRRPTCRARRPAGHIRRTHDSVRRAAERSRRAAGAPQGHRQQRHLRTRQRPPPPRHQRPHRHRHRCSWKHNVS